MTTSEQLYKTAYDAHYKAKDIEKAQAGYEALLNEYPDSSEASYARTQLDNILGSDEDQNSKELDVPKGVKLAWMSQKDTVIMSTIATIEGQRIVDTLGLVVAEHPVDPGIFKQILTNWEFSGKSGTTLKLLKEGRERCLSQLKDEAIKLNGNALVGVSIGYGQIAMGSKSIVLLTATGTAVKTVTDSHSNGDNEE